MTDDTIDTIIHSTLPLSLPFNNRRIYQVQLPIQIVLENGASPISNLRRQ